MRWATVARRAPAPLLAAAILLQPALDATAFLAVWLAILGLVLCRWHPRYARGAGAALLVLVALGGAFVLAASLTVGSETRAYFTVGGVGTTPWPLVAAGDVTIPAAITTLLVRARPPVSPRLAVTGLALALTGAAAMAMRNQWIWIGSSWTIGPVVVSGSVLTMPPFLLGQGLLLLALLAPVLRPRARSRGKARDAFGTNDAA